MKKRLCYIFIIMVSIGYFLLYPYTVVASSRLNSTHNSCSYLFGILSFLSSDSSWNYDSNSYDSHNIFLSVAILFIIVMMVIFYFIRKRYNLNKIEKKVSKVSLNQEYVEMEEKVRKVIPNFNLEEFKNIVFQKYKEIQIAQENFDYDTLRKNCTSSLYHIYQSKLEALREKKQKNIMNHFRQITFRIIDVGEDNNEVFLKIRTIIWCCNYIIDEENHVVSGNKNKRGIYEYEMTFIRSIPENVFNECPNCGSSLEKKNPMVCSDCSFNIINSNQYKWLLSKKEIVSQR